VSADSSTTPSELEQLASPAPAMNSPESRVNVVLYFITVLLLAVPNAP
jgi:hypothetical protein